MSQIFQMEIDSVREEFRPAITALKATSKTHGKKLMDLESAALNISDLTSLEGFSGRSGN